MKKILFLLVAAICTFAACDPVHEDVSNAGHITLDELLAKTSVTVDVDPATGVNGNQIFCSTSAPVNARWDIDGKSFVEVPGDDRTTILVTLTATGGKRVSDFVNRDVNYFDGIRFDFTLLKPTQPGAKIFSDMKVRLEDMKMGIIGAGYDGN